MTKNIYIYIRASFTSLIVILSEKMEYNLYTSEEELIKACQKLLTPPLYGMYTLEDKKLELNYYSSLLMLKQQNKFNSKLLWWNGLLVIATWVLAIATIILVLVTK